MESVETEDKGLAMAPAASSKRKMSMPEGSKTLSNLEMETDTLGMGEICVVSQLAPCIKSFKF